MIRLIKCSAPGWERQYPTLDEIISALRTHICADCLSGSPDSYDGVVDVEYGGRIYECRDLDTLLSTPCGLEFEIKGEEL